MRVGKERISAIMQELGLYSVRTDAKKQFKRKQQYAKQNLTFHSDRGSQYLSKTLTGLFQQLGAKQSFSATARPLDNAVAETFFSSFKREEAYRKDHNSEHHFRRSVEEYIRFYMRCGPTRH